MIELAGSVLSPLLGSVPSHHRRRDEASRAILEIFRSEEINNARRTISRFKGGDDELRNQLVRENNDGVISAAHKVMLAIQRVHDIRDDFGKGHAPKDQALIISKVEKSVEDLAVLFECLPDIDWEPTRSETNVIIKDLPKTINNPWRRERQFEIKEL